MSIIVIVISLIMKLKLNFFLLSILVPNLLCAIEQPCMQANVKESLHSFRERTLNFINLPTIVNDVANGPDKERMEYSKAKCDYIDQSLKIVQEAYQIPDDQLSKIAEKGVMLFDKFMRLSMFSFFSSEQRSRFYRCKSNLESMLSSSIIIYDYFYMKNNKLIFLIKQYITKYLEKLEESINFSALGINNDNFKDQKGLLRHIETELLAFLEVNKNPGCKSLKAYCDQYALVIPFKDMNAKFVQRGYFESILWGARLYVSEKLPDDVIHFLIQTKEESKLSIEDLVSEIKLSAENQSKNNNKKNKKKKRQVINTIKSEAESHPMTSSKEVKELKEEINISTYDENFNLQGFITVQKRKTHQQKREEISKKTHLKKQNTQEEKIKFKGTVQQHEFESIAENLADKGPYANALIGSSKLTQSLVVTVKPKHDQLEEEVSNIPQGSLQIIMQDKEVQYDLDEQQTESTSDSIQTQYTDGVIENLSGEGFIDKSVESVTCEQAWQEFIRSYQQTQMLYQEWYYLFSIEHGRVNFSSSEFLPNSGYTFSFPSYDYPQQYLHPVNLDVCSVTKKGKHNFIPAKNSLSQRIEGYVCCQNCGLFKLK